MVGKLVEVRMPKYPDCWESCGNCASGEVVVIEVLVKPGDQLRADDNIIILETGKLALDIPTPYAGTVVEVRVHEGQEMGEGEVILTLETR